MKPKADLFENYTSANEDHVQPAFKNTEGPLTRFTDIPSVIMVNTNLIGDIKVEGYEDLLNPALKGKIATADPSKSSSSYEHLVNMLYAMGQGDPDKGWDYVQKLCENLDGKLLSGSSAVYKGVADGEYAVGLTFEEGGAKYVADGAPVKLVYMKEGVISKPDGIYIIKNAKHMENAKKFIDFITSKEAQTLITQKLTTASSNNLNLDTAALLKLLHQRVNKGNRMRTIYYQGIVISLSFLFLLAATACQSRCHHNSSQGYSYPFFSYNQRYIRDIFFLSIRMGGIL